MINIDDYIQLEKDSYTIRDELGSGGQSIVWLAKRESDGVSVALKSVNIYAQQNRGKTLRKRSEVEALVIRAQEEQRFLQELGSQAAKHYVMPCLDHGVLTDTHYPDLPVVVMPLYQHDLSHFTGDYRDPNQWSFSITRLMKWVQQTATALAFIHQQHADSQPHVHRDIKPANIMLDDADDVGLIDFGIVRAANHIGTSSVVATYGYCAPEQRLAIYRKANRHKQHLITPAIDCYSLGVTIHELVVGSTRAQERISDNNTVDEHDSYLPAAGVENSEKIGHLGKLGGLTRQEKSGFRRRIEMLISNGLEASNKTENETLIIQKHACLPNKTVLAKDFADYLEKILSPWPSDRPHAAEIQTWCGLQQAALTPCLAMALSVTAETLTMGEGCELIVTLEGRGISEDLMWLEISVNEQPQKSYQLDGSTKTQHGYYLADVAHTLRITFPLPNEAGRYRIRVTAHVGQSPQSQDLLCQLVLSAEQLWQLGQQEAALQQEIRQTWLQQYQQEQLSRGSQSEKLQAVIALVNYYKTLQASHPHSAILLAQIAQLERLDFSDNQAEKKVKLKKPGRKGLTLAKKTFVFSLLLISIVSIVIYNMPSRDVTPPSKTDIFVDTSDTTPATLEETSTPPDISDVKSEKIATNEGITEATEPAITTAEITQWLESDSRDKQTNAFTQLKQRAEKKQKDSYSWLAYAYMEGKGTEKDWGQAYQWYQRSITEYPATEKTVKTSFNRLESKAADILENKSGKRRQNEKRLACQVLSTAANTGDSKAEKWLDLGYCKGVKSN